MSYVSYAMGRHNKLFRELGYPLLDVVEYPDGEWAIMEYQSLPVVPAVTSWKLVLQGMRHIEPSRGFIEKYTRKIDITKREFWDNEEKKTRKMMEEKDAVDRHREYSAEAAFQVIKKNESLMSRIAANGLCEMDLEYLARRIPLAERKAMKAGRI